jgi:hypothetical protein
MRLWSLHPHYLDPAGLVAAWREALLAKKVLEGKTTGYTHHPQLIRFRECSDPSGAITAFLETLYEESVVRGYHFDHSKIDLSVTFAAGIVVTDGQLRYGFALLQDKLSRRNVQYWKKNAAAGPLMANRIFTMIPGPPAGWEKLKLLSGD